MVVSAAGVMRRENAGKGLLMGDTKGKKDKAKGLKQQEAKRAKAEQQKQDKQKPRTP